MTSTKSQTHASELESGNAGTRIARWPCIGCNVHSTFMNSCPLSLSQRQLSSSTALITLTYFFYIYILLACPHNEGRPCVPRFYGVASRCGMGARLISPFFLASTLSDSQSVLPNTQPVRLVTR